MKNFYVRNVLMALLVCLSCSAAARLFIPFEGKDAPMHGKAETENTAAALIDPPVNDDCAGAIALVVNAAATCTTLGTGTTLGATESMDQGECSGNPDDDVWFKFVATGTAHTVQLINITSVEGDPDDEDMYFQVLSGVCDGFESLKCSDDESGTVSGLTAGETYYIRVYSYYDESRQSFSICLGTPPPPPANDECAGAVTLTVNADFACTVKTAGSTVSATESMDEGVCYGNPDDDVWYKFTATNTVHVVSLTNIVAVGEDSGTDMYMQLLSGTCDALESVKCTDSNSEFLTGLTVGEVYYIRVYSYYNEEYQNFSICIGTPPAPPANDECSAAVLLTASATLTCAAPTAGTTSGATESGQDAECNGSADDDVWYKFVATGVSHAVILSDIVSVVGDSEDMYIQVLGGTCDAPDPVKCSDDDSTVVNGLVVGETYFVRVYSYSDSALQNFKICIGTVGNAPANDECSAAVALTVNTAAVCAATPGTTLGATESSQDYECSGNPDDDVWYKFTATQESHIVTLSNITAAIGNSQDMYIEVLSGTCDAPESVDCSDDNASLITGLTIGEEYFVRVFSYSDTAYQNFSICISSIPAPPANDECAGAVTLTPSATLECSAATTGTTAGATESTAVGECDGTADDDVWYKFVATGDAHVISLSNIEAVVGYPEAYFQVLSGPCDTGESLECIDAEFGIIENLVVGETYYIKVYSSGDASLVTFDICVGTLPPPPVNDGCDGAIALVAGGTFESSPVTVSNGGTTDSGVEDPDCASYDGGDIWYSAVIPASGTLTIETHPSASGTISDTGLAVYSGTCDDLELLDCNDDGSESGDGTFSLIELENRTPGEVVYIRAWAYGNYELGTFRLAAFDATLSAGQYSLDNFTYYPNPVKNILNLNHTKEITMVSIYNLLGQKVLEKQVNATEVKMDMSVLSDGTYIINVASGDTVKAIKIVKQQ